MALKVRVIDRITSCSDISAKSFKEPALQFKLTSCLRLCEAMIWHGPFKSSIKYFSKLCCWMCFFWKIVCTYWLSDFFKNPIIQRVICFSELLLTRVCIWRLVIGQQFESWPYAQNNIINFLFNRPKFLYVHVTHVKLCFTFFHWAFSSFFWVTFSIICSKNINAFRRFSLFLTGHWIF